MREKKPPMNFPPGLVIISGYSGAGKTTIIDYVMTHCKPSLYNCVSATTRQPRKGDRHGKDYYYLSVLEFTQHISQNKFIEYVNDYARECYGTLKRELCYKPRRLGKLPLLDIDVHGHRRIREIMGEFSDILSFFIVAPSPESHEARLRGRDDGMSEEIIQLRLARAKEEELFTGEYTEVVINDIVERAGKQICRSIQKRFWKSKRYQQ